MKYIVIGLGRFGSSLCEYLSLMGHEVIGVDEDMHRVEELKNVIENVVCLDARDRYALYTLPLSDTDAVFVAVGRDFSVSVYAIALLRQIGVKRLVGRAISPVHNTVIQAIGVDETIYPEREYAQMYARKLEFPNALGGFSLSDEYHTLEVPAPPAFWGKTVAQIDLQGEYSLRLNAIKHQGRSRNFLSRYKELIDVEFNADTEVKKDDSLLLFGRLSDFKLFFKEVVS